MSESAFPRPDPDCFHEIGPGLRVVEVDTPEGPRVLAEERPTGVFPVIGDDAQGIAAGAGFPGGRSRGGPLRLRGRELLVVRGTG